ncbi:hypothetical protein Ddc_15398 [Ditylenchus destructor]|nr:hypothetical protein Ddc_15398 [Ditylenchus destructor]
MCGYFNSLLLVVLISIPFKALCAPQDPTRRDTPLFEIKKVKSEFLRIVRSTIDRTKTDAGLAVQKIDRGRMIGRWVKMSDLLDDKSIGGIRRGDTIEISYPTLMHAATYVGGGQFVHDLLAERTDDLRVLISTLWGRVRAGTDNPNKNFRHKSTVELGSIPENVRYKSGRPVRINNKTMSFLSSYPDEIIGSRARNEVNINYYKVFDFENVCDHLTTYLKHNRYYSFYLEADQLYRKMATSDKMREIEINVVLVTAEKTVVGEQAYIHIEDIASNFLACDRITHNNRVKIGIGNPRIFYKEITIMSKSDKEKLINVNEKLNAPRFFNKSQDASFTNYVHTTSIYTWDTAEIWIVVGSDHNSKVTTYKLNVHDYLQATRTNGLKIMQLTVDILIEDEGSLSAKISHGVSHDPTVLQGVKYVTISLVGTAKAEAPRCLEAVSNGGCH